VAPSPEIVLGVDLGTTFSSAAAVIDGKLHFALDGRGEACVPSVVHFPKSGPPVVGAEADKLRTADPQNTVAGIKRLVGRRADSGPARLLDAVASFRIRQPRPEGEAAVVVRSGEYAASEVAAQILRYLRERAELRFGKRIGKAVLTLPVTAEREVRDAMIRAAKAAGLEVVRTVLEPCAGAVARFGGAGVGAAPLLVYDFGGGTLDATVVRKEGARLRVLASGGDDCLGGDDLDLAFARWVASGVHRVHGVDVTKDAVLWERIQRQCELVKRALSVRPEARYQLRDAFSVGGNVQHLDYLFRREHLATEWAELVARSIEAARRTVEEAAVATETLGAVLLIGGTTYVPQVREAVAAAFPVPQAVEEDPQTAVARGAALLGGNPSLLAD